MPVRKYKTKKGVRYAIEICENGVRTYRGGFLTKLEALEWERDAKNTAPQPSVLALSEVVGGYLTDRENRTKPNTMIYKKSVLRRFIKSLGADSPFKDIAKNDVEKFLSHISNEISPKSANKYRIELSALWAWANREGIAIGNPPRQTEPYAVKKTIKYIPPADDIKKILSAAKPGLEKDFLTCLLHTAARISEIRMLTWQDVNFARETVILWTSKRRGGNQEPRTLAMSPTLREILARREAERTGAELYVFTDPKTGTAYTRTCDTMKYFMRDICARADVTLFGAHSLRHYLATYFDDPRRAQKILGHMNLKTTEIYLHDLEVDRGAASIFESVTYGITYEKEEDDKKGAAVLQ